MSIVVLSRKWCSMTRKVGVWMQNPCGPPIERKRLEALTALPSLRNNALQSVLMSIAAALKKQKRDEPDRFCCENRQGVAGKSTNRQP